MAYNRTTIMDAFNAAGHFTQQALGYMDAAKRREADAFLRNIPAEFATDIQNRMRDNPFNYTGDPDNSEELNKYAQEYNEELANYAREWYAKKIGNKTASPYVRRNVDQMQTQALETLRNAALVKQDEWRTQREYVSLEEDCGKYVEAVKKRDMTPQQAVESIYNRIELSGTRVEINPQKRNEIRKEKTVAVYKGNAASILGKVNDVNDIEAAMKKARDDFAFMPTETLNAYDKEGNVTGTEKSPWGFNGKDEWEKALVEQETKRIQGERFELFREKQAYMERLAVSGDYSGAINFAKAWGAEWNKYYNPKNKEFANSNDDLRDRGSGFFNIKTLEGYLKHGSEGKKALELDISPGRFIRAVLPGGGGFVDMGEDVEGINVESMRDSWEKFISLKEQAFRLGRGENGYGAIADSDWANEREEWFGKFKDEMKKIMQEDEHKTLWKTYSKLLDYDTYLDKKTPYYLKGNIEEEQRKRFIQDCVSLTMDLVWNGVTDPVELDNRVKAFIVGDLDKKLKWGQTPNKEGDLIKKLAAWDKEVVTEGKAKDRVFSKLRMESAKIFSAEPGEDELVWRDKNFKNDAYGVRDAEWGYAYKLLGLPKEQLHPGWMLSDDKERDPIAKGIFTVKEGEKKGTYRLGYDEKSNPYLLKKNDDSWEKTEYKMTLPLTQKEKKQLYEDTKDEYIRQIRNGKNPLTGKNFDFSNPPPTWKYSIDEWNNPNTSKTIVWANYFMNNQEER